VIVTGDRDQIVSPKENAYKLRQRIPQAQLVELRGVGHEIPLTSPDSVYSALKLLTFSFVERLRSEQPKTSPIDSITHLLIKQFSLGDRGPGRI